MSSNGPNNDPGQDSSLSGLGIQVLIVAVTSFVCLSAFELMRKKKPKLFSPKTFFSKSYPLKTAPAGMFKWVPTVMRVKDAGIDDLIGGDAAMLLYYLKYAAYLFTAASVISLFMLIPANVSAGGGNLTGLPEISLANVLKGRSIMWVHAVAAWLFSGLCYLFLIKMHMAYISIFQRHRQRLMNTQTGRTIMIENLPDELKNDAELQQYFTSVRIGSIDETHVYRYIPKLQDRIKSYNKHLSSFESSLIKYSSSIVDSRGMVAAVPGNHWLTAAHTDVETMLWDRVAEDPSTLCTIPIEYTPTTRIQRMSKKVNALEYHFNKMESSQERVVRYRAEAKTNQIVGETHTAFITLSEPSDALKASQTLIHSKPLRCTVRMAPERRNLIWDNLQFTMLYKTIASVIVTALVVALTFFWLIPVAAIVSLTSLSQLSAVLPGLAAVANSSSALRGFLQNVLPTILVSVLMSLLPAIIYALSAQEKPTTYSKLDTVTMGRYYFFLVFNVFLVFTLGGTVLKSLNAIINNPASIVTMLATQLPNNANFFVDYIVLGLSGFAMQLLQIGRMVMCALKKYLNKSPRSKAMFYGRQTYCYYTGFPGHMITFMVTAAYAIIQPFIVIPAAIYFFLYYVSTKYMFMYIYSPQYETGGTMWSLVFDCTTTSILIFQLTLIGLLGLKEAIGPPIVLLPLLFLTLFVRVYCKGLLKKYSLTLPLDKAIAGYGTSDLPSPPANGPNVAATRVIEFVPGNEDEFVGDHPQTPKKQESVRNEAYFFNKEDFAHYENPALVEPLEPVWLPASMNALKTRNVDWALCGRAAPTENSASSSNSSQITNVHDEERIDSMV